MFNVTMVNNHEAKYGYGFPTVSVKIVLVEKTAQMAVMNAVILSVNVKIRSVLVRLDL